MTVKPPPDRKGSAEAAREARLAREAAALRANLHRRKAQARAQTQLREAPPPVPPADAPEDPG